jgi:copper(I)-binding protein
MNRIRLPAIGPIILLLAAMLWGGSQGAAHPGHTGTEASPPASPIATPGNTGTGVVYLTIANHGDASDRLVSARTSAAVTVEMHDMTIENGVMSMTPLPNGLEIPAGETVTFEPQGMHLMLVNLTQDLRPGTQFEIVLRFEHAGNATVIVTVGADPPEDDTPMTVGDLDITQAWSLPAPMLTASQG